MAYNLDGSDDLFDSREVIERIAELESLAETMSDEEETQEARAGAYEEYDADEYAALIEFRDEYDGQFGDSFEDGITFIHEDYFTDAMKELCEDVGYLPEGTPDWLVIDWDETADNLRVDYSEAEFRGSTYWAR